MPQESQHRQACSHAHGGDHDHDHAHDHSHSHAGHNHGHHGHHHHGHHGHHHGAGNRKGLTYALLITAGIMILEFVGGLWTNSLALLSDSGHMLSDAGSLALSLFAMWLAARPASPRRSF